MHSASTPDLSSSSVMSNARPRYNHRIPRMRVPTSSGRRLAWLTLFLFGAIFTSAKLRASDLGDSARQLARKVAAASGPGAFFIEVNNRSSLDDKSAREVRGALEAQLQSEGVHGAKPDRASGTITVLLSESLREYVWTAEVVSGSDEKKVVLISLPRLALGSLFTTALPVVLKTSLLFAQPQPVLDAALVDMPGGARLLVLGDTSVNIYHRLGATPSGHWELEATLPIGHARGFPRDVRGRLFLRRDHLFDVYLPGTLCHSSAAMPLTLGCSESDDPWPLSADEAGARAFFAVSRNFFTGALSPGAGKISNVPSFYSAAMLPRASYPLWIFAAVDGSVHLVDGITDQAIHNVAWGSDLAAVRSACGTGMQLLVSESGDSAHDGLRAFEIPDRDPVAVSSVTEFDGRVVALWTEAGGSNVIAVVRRRDSGMYEAYRVSLVCGN